MKIAHVVTYISADGAFGGPVAVAASQAEQLAREGHEVEIIAGWDGVAAFEVPGVKITLHKVRRVAPGFSGLVAPRLQRQLRTERYDCVHVHLARDLITMPAARLLAQTGRRFVVQPHGMVMPDSRLRARVFDRYAIRRILLEAASVFALTKRETDGLICVSGGDFLAPVIIANGIRAIDSAEFGQAVDPPQVLFLARLHPRKRVMAFAEMAASLISQGITATFHVVGPDEGELAQLQDFIEREDLAKVLRYEGTVGAGAGAQRISQATIFVLPSIGEVFPMTVLEAMSVGCAVVLSEDCGMAPELNRRGAAVIVDGSISALAAAVRTLLDNPAHRDRIVRASRDALTDWLSIEVVASVLTRHYSQPSAQNS